MKSRIMFPRETLLVEIERRCGDPACNARAFIGLTKAEARVYTGFECERCQQRTDDVLSERDIPDWWEELKVTALDGVRAARAQEISEPGETVTRLSEAWRRVSGREERGAEAEPREGEESF